MRARAAFAADRNQGFEIWPDLRHTTPSRLKDKGAVSHEL